METVILLERCFCFFHSNFSLRDFSHGKPKPKGLLAGLSQVSTFHFTEAEQGNVIRRKLANRLRSKYFQ